MNKIWGKVSHGKNRGGKLGFPTANINLHKKTPEGIYISQTRFQKKKFESVTFIGNAKTFGDKKILAETYIFAFSGDLYNRWISVELIRKIRDNKKFNNADSLVAQIKKDIEIAKKYFKNN